jgi:hypothetical protein
MLTKDAKSNFAIVALVQDAVAGALAHKLPLAKFVAHEPTTFGHELRAGQPLPRNLALDFSPLLDVLKLPELGGLSVTDLTAEKLIQTLVDPSRELKSIFESGDPAAILARMHDFFDRKPNLKNLSSILGSFLEGQFGIALSLVTTFKNLIDPGFPRAVADACLEYFFGRDGFVTVDEIHVIPPMQFSGTPQGLGDLKGFLSEKNADRYVRDLISVTVEAAGDVQYQLRSRYPQMLAQLTAPQQDTAKRWFKGFSAMAEAGVMTAVEETLLGIATFQGNRLAAASAGAYAGTAARKATQHVFLAEFGVS